MSMAEKHHPDWKQSALAPPSLRGSAFRTLYRLRPFLIIAAVVIAFFWKLVLTRQYTWLAGPDFAQMVLPWFQFQALEWHHGRFPLWDPYAWAGHPLLGQAQPGSAYPLNWILFLLPMSHGWISQIALHWYYVLTRVLGAITFYLLCRSLDRSRHASLIAGITYAIGGFLGNVEWPQMVNGAVWAPLVFMFQFRAIRGEKPLANSVFSGFFLGLMWLSGHHQMPLFVSLGSGFLWLYIILSEGRINVRVGLRAVVAIAVGFLVSALQTLPTAEYGRIARRWASYGEPLRWNEVIPYPVHENLSFKPLSLLNIFIPGLDLNITPMIGIAAFTLALVGLVMAWQDLRVRYLASLALGGLLFALGPNSVFHGILYAVIPVVEKARVPAQAIILFSLGTCAVLAYGIDYFSRLTSRTVLGISGTLLGFGAIVSFGGFFLFLGKVVALNGDTRFMMTALASLLLAGLLLAWHRAAITPATAMTLLLGLILLEIGNVTTYTFAHVDQKDRMADLNRLKEDADIAAFLRAQPGFPRVMYDQEVLPNNFGAWYGIETFTTYEASAPALLWRRDPFGVRTRSLLGIRYYIGTKPLNPDQPEVFKGASGRNVYQWPAMPRVWSVHQVAQVNDVQATGQLTDSAVDLATRTFSTIKPPAVSQCAGSDSVELKQHLANRVFIEASMACRGIVVLDDQYFPGWKATVDGNPAPIIDAYGLVRGVPVDSGKHIIEFRYRPASVLWGGTLTALGSLIALVVAIRSRH